MRFVQDEVGGAAGGGADLSADPLELVSLVTGHPESLDTIFRGDGSERAARERQEADALAKWNAFASIQAEARGAVRHSLNYANSHFNRATENFKCGAAAERGGHRGALSALHRRLRKRVSDLPAVMPPAALAGLGGGLVAQACTNLKKALQGVTQAHNLCRFHYDNHAPALLLSQVKMGAVGPAAELSAQILALRSLILATMDEKITFAGPHKDDDGDGSDAAGTDSSSSGGGVEARAVAAMGDAASDGGSN